MRGAIYRWFTFPCNFCSGVHSNVRRKRKRGHVFARMEVPGLAPSPLYATICVAIPQCPARYAMAQLKERRYLMKNSVQSLALAAAVAGLMGGTAVRMNAQTAQANGTPTATHAGVMLVQDAPVAKHSCKGKNDCKGQGGGKNAGKNDCKGKGGCATDGSKPPKKA